MKYYQDTETGGVHAFDDEVDVAELMRTNRNVPKTLSEKVVQKPSESHVWFNGEWVKDTDVPPDYEPPISSVPAYNPAWVAFLQPYSAVLARPEDRLEVTLEQINSNSYDSDKLSKAVMSLSLNDNGLHALISYDGSVAIPRNHQYPTSEAAITGLNQVLCALLLGGIHTELVSPGELCGGILHNGVDIFVVNSTMHGNLRHKWASLTERLAPLMHPRVLHVEDLANAYRHGMAIMDVVKNFSPFFLLHGYTSMTRQNRSDALGSLWIVVEQLTWAIWDHKFMTSPQFHPSCEMKNRRDSLKGDNRTWPISVKHELLWQTKLLSDQCYVALSAARKQRNELVHKGDTPDFQTISELWIYLSELFETASGISQNPMRQLVPIEAPSLNLPPKTNFDDWLQLTKELPSGR